MLIEFIIPEPHLLIMEFAMRGRLLSLLRAAKTAIINSHSGAMGPRNFGPLSPRRLTGFAHDIARGMEYISEKKVKICQFHQRYYIMTRITVRLSDRTSRSCYKKCSAGS